MFLFAFAVSCGSGSGGGSKTDPGTGTIEIPFVPDVDGNPLQPDPFFRPDIVGDPIYKSGMNFTIIHDGEKYTLTANNQNRNIYSFVPKNFDKGTFIVGALANEDVTLMVYRLDGRNADNNFIGLSMSGNNVKTFPTTNTYYSGQYIAFDKDGNKTGEWDMEIYLDFNNIRNSYGVDKESRKTIGIHFTTASERTISGTISDTNHDANNVGFGLYGDNGDTLAGGYANETGMGALIAEN